jgi:hypothetical protein
MMRYSWQLKEFEVQERLPPKYHNVVQGVIMQGKTHPLTEGRQGLTPLCKLLMLAELNCKP